MYIDKQLNNKDFKLKEWEVQIELSPNIQVMLEQANFSNSKSERKILQVFCKY